MVILQQKSQERHDCCPAKLQWIVKLNSHSQLFHLVALSSVSQIIYSQLCKYTTAQLLVNYPWHTCKNFCTIFWISVVETHFTKVHIVSPESNWALGSENISCVSPEKKEPVDFLLIGCCHGHHINGGNSRTTAGSESLHTHRSLWYKPLQVIERNFLLSKLFRPRQRLTSHWHFRMADRWHFFRASRHANVARKCFRKVLE